MDYAYIYYPKRVKDLADQFPPVKFLPQALAEKLRPYYPPVPGCLDIDAFGPEIGIIGCFWPNESKLKVSLEKARANRVKVIGCDQMLLRESQLDRAFLEGLGMQVVYGDFAALFAGLEGIRQLMRIKGLSWNQTKFVILGRHMPLCSMMARSLAREARYLTLVGSLDREVEKLSAQIMYESGLALKISNSFRETMSEADVVIAVSEEDLPRAASYAQGAVFFDLTGGKKENGSGLLHWKENSFLINEKFGSLGKRPLCLAAIPNALVEVIISFLEQSNELFFYQKEMTINQIKETLGLFKRHGFALKFPGNTGFDSSSMP